MWLNEREADAAVWRRVQGQGRVLHHRLHLLQTTDDRKPHLHTARPPPRVRDEELNGQKTETARAEGVTSASREIVTWDADQARGHSESDGQSQFIWKISATYYDQFTVMEKSISHFLTLLSKFYSFPNPFLILPLFLALCFWLASTTSILTYSHALSAHRRPLTGEDKNMTR